MSSTAETMAKIAKVPDILQAATLLEILDLLNGEKATSVVRRYIEKNPDIQKILKEGVARGSS